MKQSGGHRFGYSNLVSILRYCYDIGIEHITVYAFSVDNFRRKLEEVQSTMDLIKEKIDELLETQSIVKDRGVRIKFWGNISLLNDAVRQSVEKAMRSTSGNSGPVLHVCLAYSSTDEITQAIQSSCREKRNGMHDDHGRKKDPRARDDVISVEDLERHLYGIGCPDPDVIIRTSGQTRLSNFLLWQSSFSHLQNPKPLWPEFSLWHLVLAIVEYQRVFHFFTGEAYLCFEIIKVANIGGK